MAISKRHLKRRSQITRKKKQWLYRGYKLKNKGTGWDGKGGYMKTDGESRVCCYNRRHQFQRYATDDEQANFGMRRQSIF